jgi:flavin reductase (DIM6/NTAB) family NADH-FMN oxidoreductase RutF
MSKRTYTKLDFPVSQIRRFLEPGPVVLVSSAWRGETNIMTMAWQTVMEFEPSLVGCMITAANHSFELIRKSKECVINLPTVDLIDEVIGIGNTTGADMDKFEHFHLTASPAKKVKAPLIKECYANFECRIFDGALLNKYNFFIFEVVKAHVPSSPKHPRTLHYRGDGAFMISGEEISHKKGFKPQNL